MGWEKAGLHVEYTEQFTLVLLLIIYCSICLIIIIVNTLQPYLGFIFQVVMAGNLTSFAHPSIIKCWAHIKRSIHISLPQLSLLRTPAPSKSLTIPSKSLSHWEDLHPAPFFSTRLSLKCISSQLPLDANLLYRFV